MEFHMPDGTVLKNCDDVDKYYNLGEFTTSRRLRWGWTEEECAKNEQNSRYTFNMPDGTVAKSYSDIDRYYSLCRGMTSVRLSNGWTIEECINNKRVGSYKRKKPTKRTFHMPDSTVVKSCSGVDRYYNLKIGTTAGRIHRGWTEEECAINSRKKDKSSPVDKADTVADYDFYMPDGSVVHSCKEVDDFYGKQEGTTRKRLQFGWTERECAGDKVLKRNAGYIFYMPDGTVLEDVSKVDKYHRLRRNTTFNRLRSGWTEEECAYNEKGHSGISVEDNYTFHMPDGSTLNTVAGVDWYHNLPNGRTAYRLSSGWTVEECARNGKEEHVFSMPDGTVVNSYNAIDRYFKIAQGTTRARIARGWSLEECLVNRRRGIDYKFNMPDGSVLTDCILVDRYHHLEDGTTETRVDSGWTFDECAYNIKECKGKTVECSVDEEHKSRSKWESGHDFCMPDGSILHSMDDVDIYYNLPEGTTWVRYYHDCWTLEECAVNKKKKQSNRYTFTLPDGSVVHTVKEVDDYFGFTRGRTSARLHSGWTVEECSNNTKARAGKYNFTLPDGSTVHTAIDVDNYFGLRKGKTGYRLQKGWTVDECANNKRVSVENFKLKMPDGSVAKSYYDIDAYYNFQEGTTQNRINSGWTLEDCRINKRNTTRYKFEMPDGSIFMCCSDVDRYYNLEDGTTEVRLRKGWTCRECGMNMQGIEEVENTCVQEERVQKYSFQMPDGRVLHTAGAVDRYYRFSNKRTAGRLSHGWSVEECANNKRVNPKAKEEFIMPDGSILYSMTDVDRYYNLTSGTTRARHKVKNWTVEECANNADSKRYSGIYRFVLPDNNVVNATVDVDKYYGLRSGKTTYRLRNGWSVDECARNEKMFDTVFHLEMPDGSKVSSCNEIDDYYDLQYGTTELRRQKGWTDIECIMNRKGAVAVEYVQRVNNVDWSELKNNDYATTTTVKEYNFYMPDGSVLTSHFDVDKYYKLSSGTTFNRLTKGWTEEDCATNRRYTGTVNIVSNGKTKHFEMPDGSSPVMCTSVDKYYNLKEGTTEVRLSTGWTVEECANNRLDSSVEDDFNVFVLSEDKVCYSCYDLDHYHNIRYGTTMSRLRDGWTKEECVANERRG